jgi:16S rRNA (cytidine1402-2'-O)-methyltransferase
MAHLGLKKPLYAYHQHSGASVAAEIATTLQEGMSLALVSDAGTPGINDPGGKLVAELTATVPDLRVVPIPGPNAAVTALSVSGFPADTYRYWGFVPHKKGRVTFFKELAECPETVVFYESKHRIGKTMEAMAQVMPERRVMVARELTKKFETLYRGTPADIAPRLSGDDALGEFVVVVAPQNWK